MRRSMLALGMLLALPSTPLEASITPSIHSMTVEVAPSASEKRAAERERIQLLQALQERLTNCIAQTMQAYPRKDDVTDRITRSFSACPKPSAAYVHELDRQYGHGEGRKIFLGPYLDVLPVLLQKRGIE